jgi:biotin transport system substrate-specific component
MSQVSQPSISQARWLAHRGVLQIGVMLSLATLTVVGAKVQAPFYPVAVSLQTAAVVFAGLWAGSRLGAASQLTYLALGLAGLPVFLMPGAGPAYFVGPTAGYLLAFPIAAAIAGLACGRRLVARTLAALAAVWTIVLCGASWLAIGSYGTFWADGFVPFVLPEAIKAVLIAWGVGLIPTRRVGPRSAPR